MGKRIEFGHFSLDTEGPQLFRDGQEIKLSPQALRLLVEIAKEPGVTRSKNELITKVWGTPKKGVSDNTFDRNLHAIRDALHPYGKAHIQTRNKLGCTFVLKVADDRLELTPEEENEMFADFFGAAIFEKEVIFVFDYRKIEDRESHRMETTYRPPVRESDGAVPQPEGIDFWLPSQDLRASIYLSNVIFSHTGKGFMFLEDEMAQRDKSDNTTVSLGLGFNSYTHHLRNRFGPEFFSIDWGDSPKLSGFYTDNLRINGICPAPEEGFDDCLVARIVLPGEPGKRNKLRFCCSGRTAAGTAAAGNALARKWIDFVRLYKQTNHDLNRDSLAIGIRHQTDKDLSPALDNTGEILFLEDGEKWLSWSRVRGID